MLIELKELNTWEEFVELEKGQPAGKFIYRGHSNDISIAGTTEWRINSSFKRRFSNNEIRFESFINQQLQKGLFRDHFKNYLFRGGGILAETGLLEKIYYLQHHGFPTCFIDFTKNPLIALYFALSNIIVPAVRKESNSVSLTFPENSYFTIIKIDILGFQKILKIKTISDPNLYWNYNDYSLSFTGFNHIKLAFDLTPDKKLKSDLNVNLIKQEGCFLFYDNTDLNDEYPFENLIEDLSFNSISCDVPIIYKYRIPYHSILSGSFESEKKSLFNFLSSGNTTGRNLFDDFQGIKHDLMFYLNS